MGLFTVTHSLTHSYFDLSISHFISHNFLQVCFMSRTLGFPDNGIMDTSG